jgi:D-alanyl-D-alanine carboxypeptidase
MPVKRRAPAAGVPTASATVSSDPIKPIAVKTIKVKLAPTHTATLAPAAFMIPVTDDAAAPAPAAPLAFAPVPAPAPVAVPMPKPAQPELQAAAPMPAPAPAPQAEPVRPAPLPVVAAVAPAPEPVAPAPAPKAEPAAPPARSTHAHTGWIVQVGAFATESEAKQHLEAAQSKAKNLLGRADSFTEAVTKGDKTFYRARFAGLERDKAEATCRQLRRSDIACMAVKN